VRATVDYDPHVIEQFAESLYRKALSAQKGSAVVGVVLGAAFGGIPLTSLGNNWPIPHSFGFATLIVGAIIGGLIGYVIGDARAFGYKLQAQAALCQVEIQRNTQASVHATLVHAAATSPEPARAGNGTGASSPRRLARLVIAVGGVLIAAGCFLPWVSIGVDPGGLPLTATLPGTDGGYGKSRWMG